MARTLSDALREVPDRRGRKGRRIPLHAILALAIATTLAGSDSLIAIFRWGRRLRPEALQLLGFADGSAPCHATYHHVFQSLDTDALSRVLGAFASADARGGHIAIAGKTLKGSRRHDANPRCRVAAKTIKNRGAHKANGPNRAPRSRRPQRTGE